MERPVCPLCGKWISEWMQASGKTITVKSVVVHISCAMDHDLSVAELEKRVAS